MPGMSNTARPTAYINMSKREGQKARGMKLSKTMKKSS